MTRIFEDDGSVVPVSVIEATPNTVTRIRSDEQDGYSALQVTYGTQKVQRLSGGEAGHFAKAGVEALGAEALAAVGMTAIAVVGRTAINAGTKPRGRAIPMSTAATTKLHALRTKTDDAPESP